MTQHRKEYLVSFILEQLDMMFKIISDEENYHFMYFMHLNFFILPELSKMQAILYH